MLSRQIIFAFLVFSTHAGFCQNEEEPIEYSLPAPDWIAGLKNGKVAGWIYDPEDMTKVRAATSQRKNFPVSNLTDGDVLTTWAEDEAGAGIGAVAVVDVDSSSLPLRIWPGYGKSTTLFETHNRPRKIKIYLLGTFCHDCTPVICMAGDFSVVGIAEQELEDNNRFHLLTVPDLKIIYDSVACSGPGGYERDKSHYIYKLAIQILSVYKGTRYNETCISEIMDTQAYSSWIKKQKAELKK